MPRRLCALRTLAACVPPTKNDFCAFLAFGARISLGTNPSSVETAGQVYNQTNAFVYLGGNVNHSADLSIQVDRRMRSAWCSFRKYTLEQYDRPSAPLELKLRMLRVEVTRDNAVRLRHVESARVPLRHTAPSPPQVLDSLHRLGKAQSRRPTDYLSGHAYQDGK